MLCLSLESRGGDDSREGTGKRKANHTQGQHRATSPLLTRARVLDPLFGNIQILKKKKRVYDRHASSFEGKCHVSVLNMDLKF